MTKAEARKLRKFIELMSVNATDEEALDNILAFPKWAEGKAYTVGGRLRYENSLYKVIQAHTSQADWTPNIAVSLFVKVSIEEYPDWVQPTGSHDAYAKGDKVTYDEKHWISTVDANVWAPGVYGWDML